MTSGTTNITTQSSDAKPFTAACIAAGLFREIDVELAVYQLVMHAHTWALKYWRLNKITTLDHYLMTGFEFFVRAAASPKGLSVYAAFYHRQVGPSVVRRGRCGVLPGQEPWLLRCA